jgi:tRNA(His) 5'-end guanylyltransferase
MIKDSLGDRIKAYESVTNYKLLPKTPLFIRIDGKAFHTFTRGLKKPYSEVLIATMANAALETSKHMSGFKLAYVQSDEATFMLTDYDTYATQPWFNYELNKLVSISASLFTAYFNDFWQMQQEEVSRGPRLAVFDSRAFSMPIEDAPNAFIWRQRDWERNSIQMLARANYSHNELAGQKIPDIHEMLHKKGINWAKQTEQIKNGTWVHKDGTFSYGKETYETIKATIAPQVES